MVDQAGTSAHRIRIGLTGLAFAFLVVLLGSAISRSGEDATETASAAANRAGPNEPLAELGVAPGAAEAADNSSNSSQ